MSGRLNFETYNRSNTKMTIRHIGLYTPVRVYHICITNKRLKISTYILLRMLNYYGLSLLSSY